MGPFLATAMVILEVAVFQVAGDVHEGRQARDVIRRHLAPAPDVREPLLDGGMHVTNLYRAQLRAAIETEGASEYARAARFVELIYEPFRDFWRRYSRRSGGLRHLAPRIGRHHGRRTLEASPRAGSHGRARQGWHHEAEIRDRFERDLAAGDASLARAYANRSSGPFPDGPGALGYFIGLRVVQAYVERHGPDSWRRIYDLTPAQVLELSGYLGDGSRDPRIDPAAGSR